MHQEVWKLKQETLWINLLELEQEVLYIPAVWDALTV